MSAIKECGQMLFDASLPEVFLVAVPVKLTPVEVRIALKGQGLSRSSWPFCLSIVSIGQPLGPVREVHPIAPQTSSNVTPHAPRSCCHRTPNAFMLPLHNKLHTNCIPKKQLPGSNRTAPEACPHYLHHTAICVLR